jgi:hypothetical protein
MIPGQSPSGYCQGVSHLSPVFTVYHTLTLMEKSSPAMPPAEMEGPRRRVLDDVLPLLPFEAGATLRQPL